MNSSLVILTDGNLVAERLAHYFADVAQSLDALATPTMHWTIKRNNWNGTIEVIGALLCYFYSKFDKEPARKAQMDPLQDELISRLSIPPKELDFRGVWKAEKRQGRFYPGYSYDYTEYAVLEETLHLSPGGLPEELQCKLAVLSEHKEMAGKYERAAAAVVGQLEIIKSVVPNAASISQKVLELEQLGGVLGPARLKQDREHFQFLLADYLGASKITAEANLPTHDHFSGLGD
ncbi:MAG TPA: hypothetical protein VMQ44_03405 [Candidatus Saccharimonadales bacterium]|nr:hypothetical protein [Candidatus Saccharimonadales bacterium]